MLQKVIINGITNGRAVVGRLRVAAGAGGAASPGRTAGHGRTKSQKELLKPPQKQQGWCCLCPQLCPGNCIPALSLTNPDCSAGCVCFSLQGCEGAAECDFFGNELPKWQVAEVARGCTSPAVTAACLDLTPLPKLHHPSVISCTVNSPQSHIKR